MRDYKERPQQNLRTNIFSSLAVSKISKHKLYKFVLWKISYARGKFYISLAWRFHERCFHATHVRLGNSLKMSLSSLCIEVKRVRKKADPGIGGMMCLRNFMQPWLLILMRPKWPCHVSTFRFDSLWAHSTMSVSGFAAEDQTWTRTWRTCPKGPSQTLCLPILPPHLKGVKIRWRRFTYSLLWSVRTYLSFWGKGS